MATGRPSKYRREFDEQAYKLCLLSATDKDLADFFEVTEATINGWKTKHPSFFEALKAGKAVADAKVSESLYQRATGYDCPEDKVFCTNGEVTIVPTTKHYPPDPTSMIFWLKNRQREKWTDSKEFTGAGGKDLIPESVPAIDVARRMAYLLTRGLKDAVESEG